MREKWNYPRLDESYLYLDITIIGVIYASNVLIMAVLQKNNYFIKIIDFDLIYSLNGFWNRSKHL
jgi:hypothetical protein